MFKPTTWEELYRSYEKQNQVLSYKNAVDILTGKVALDPQEHIAAVNNIFFRVNNDFRKYLESRRHHAKKSPKKKKSPTK